MEIPKSYDPKIEEARVQTFWQEKKVFVFNPDTKKQIFSIDTPPPTMSGRMHIGHAFSFSQQDIVARFWRMKGFEVFYPFGTDDNGLPTEKLVQKERKVLATKMQRGEFINLCLDFIKQERPAFIKDWIDIGMSCDFSNPYSTIDDNSRRIAQKTFLDLAKKDLVYRKEAPVIWDTVFQSAIAQAELQDVERQSFFNDIVFKTTEGNDFIIATTRPELLPACVAVFVHPDDDRYKKLIGTYATVPLFGFAVPILPDEKADPSKGTGAVMCCTFGDQTDIEWYKKHKLPLKMAITRDGRMGTIAGKYAGLKIEEAKKQIIEDLKEAKLLVRQTQITQIVNVGERSGVPVEIINSKQWYIAYLDKKDLFFESAQKLEWKPEFMKHRLENWIRGLNWDWSVSRQRHYGVPIPVWYDEQGTVYYPDESQLPVDPVKDRPNSAPKDVKLIPETDVFDTWFTSASSPFLATEPYKNHPVIKKLIPMSLRPQAHDIINFWLFYTMAKTQLLHGHNPWKTAAISGYVLASSGDKMSKSKGNTITPQEVRKKFSADAIRYWAAGSKLGEDLPYQEKDLVTANKLVNKLWNAGKFVSMFVGKSSCEKPIALHQNDQWLLAELNIVIKDATAHFENYEYAKARETIDTFFWNVFCDAYLESIKKIMYEPLTYPRGTLESTQYTLMTSFTDILKLYAPFVPHITENLYQYLVVKDLEKSIHISSWPTPYEVKEDVITYGRIIQELLSATRRYKSSRSMPLNTPIEPTMIVGCKKEIQSRLEQWKEIVMGTVAAANVIFTTPESMTEQISFSVGDLLVLAPLVVKDKEEKKEEKK